MSKQEQTPIEHAEHKRLKRQLPERANHAKDEVPESFYEKDVPRFIPQLPYLPEKYRVGEYDEVVTLYRADSLNKLSGEITPTATDEEVMDFYHQIASAVQNEQHDRLDALIHTHTVYTHRDGTATPFVSASPFRGFSQHFVPDQNGGIATIEVPANRVIAARTTTSEGLPEEVLVFGGIHEEEIIDVSPALSTKSDKEINDLVISYWTKQQSGGKPAYPIDFFYQKPVR